MKVTKILIISLLAVVLSITACNDEFLEVLPTGQLAEAQLQSRAGLDGALIGSYSILLGRGGFYDDASSWFWGSVRGGDAYKGSDAGDQSIVNEVYTYQPQSTNGEIFSIYANQYEGIARANATLKLVSETGEQVSVAEKTRVTAEARFLRAHYYHHLKKMFNNTPYVDETWNGIDPVPNNQDLYPFIEADLQFAFDNLPEQQINVGRANKWAAAAYLGKVYLYQGKYQQAKSMFDQAINNGVNAAGVKYELQPNYADLWRTSNDNGPETVFASQAAANTGSINNANPAHVLNFMQGGPGGCCGFNQPSFDLVNSFRTDASGLPILDNSYNDPGKALADDNLLASEDAFVQDQGNIDPRLDHSVGRRGIPYLDWGNHPGRVWIRDYTNGGPYSPKKFVYAQNQAGSETDGSSWTPGYTSINYKIIRFADVLLMAAEAEVELGNLEAARAYVNRVRERAANSALLKEDGNPAANYVVNLYSSPWSDANTARAAVRMERKIELSGEGHRMFDLVRWGIAAPELNRYIEHNNSKLVASPFSGASFQSGVDEFLPIPQQEIDLQGPNVLSQNPGY